MTSFVIAQIYMIIAITEKFSKKEGLHLANIIRRKLFSRGKGRNDISQKMKIYFSIYNVVFTRMSKEM